MKKFQRKLIIYSSIIISAILVGTLFYSANNSSGILSYTIPNLPEFSVATKIPDITCTVQQINTIVDSQGRTVTVKSSQRFSDNPTLALLATTSNNPLAGMVPEVVFGCSAPADITVAPSTLTLRVFASNIQGGSIPVDVKTITTSQVKLAKGSNELKSLGWFSIYGRDVEPLINSDTKFTSYMKFQISGNIQIYYTGYPNAKYTFPVTVSSIPTEYSAFVDAKYSPTTSTVKASDVDNDEILDVYDICPGTPETFNGYKDADGCADTNPTTPAPTPTPTPQPPVTPTTCPTGQVWATDKCVPNAYTGIFGLGYKIVLGSRTIENDLTKLEGKPISLNPLDFINFENDRFVTMLIQPIIKLDQSTQFLNPGTSSLIYKGLIILPSGKELEIPGFGTSGSNKLTKDSSQYIHLPPVEMTSDMISSVLRNSKDVSQTNPTDVTLNIRIDGSFDFTDSQTSKKLQGVLKDAGFAYFITFDPKIVDDPNKEPCQGLSGQELVDCIGIKCGQNTADDAYCTPEPGASGGYCEGLTLQQCIDKGKDAPTTDAPKGSVSSGKKDPTTNGTALICDGTISLSTCLEQGSAISNKATEQLSSIFGLDQQTFMIYLGIGLVFVLIIAIIIKKATKKA